MHTPGPWKAYWENGHIPGAENDWMIVTDGSGAIVANVNTETGPDAASFPATRKMPAEANARLIAAAPDLLEAAKGVLAGWDGNKGEACGEDINVLRAAISKAEGGAQ